jgi:methionine synthase II (cobalamin-independent)
MSMMDEERLAIEAVQRDPLRFADLYEPNFERIDTFKVRRVRDRHQVEDRPGRSVREPVVPGNADCGEPIAVAWA